MPTLKARKFDDIRYSILAGMVALSTIAGVFLLAGH